MVFQNYAVFPHLSVQDNIRYGLKARHVRAKEQGERARQEARKILAENDIRLAEAQRAACKIIDEGHALVATMKEEAAERAKGEADAIVAQARGEIDRELQKSLEELKGTRH